MTAASAEMLGNGVTTSVEMYFHPERIAAAVGTTGARAVIATPLLPLPGLPPFDEQLRAAVELATERPATAPSSTASARTPPTRCRCRCCGTPPAPPASTGCCCTCTSPRPRPRAPTCWPGTGCRCPRCSPPTTSWAAGCSPRTACTWTTATSSCGGVRRRRLPLPGQQRQAGQRHRPAAGDARPRHPRRAWAPTARRPTTAWTCFADLRLAASLARLVGRSADRAHRRRGVLARHRRPRPTRSAGRTWGSSRRAGAPTSCTSTPGTWCSSPWAIRPTCSPTSSGPARAGTCATSGWAAGRSCRDGASTTVDTEALRHDVAAGPRGSPRLSRLKLSSTKRLTTPRDRS